MASLAWQARLAGGWRSWAPQARRAATPGGSFAHCAPVPVGCSLQRHAQQAAAAVEPLQSVVENPRRARRQRQQEVRQAPPPQCAMFTRGLAVLVVLVPAVLGMGKLVVRQSGCRGCRSVPLPLLLLAGLLVRGGGGVTLALLHGGSRLGQARAAHARPDARRNATRRGATVAAGRRVPGWRRCRQRYRRWVFLSGTPCPTIPLFLCAHEQWFEPGMLGAVASWRTATAAWLAPRTLANRAHSHPWSTPACRRRRDTARNTHGLPRARTPA